MKTFRSFFSTVLLYFLFSFIICLPEAKSSPELTTIAQDVSVEPNQNLIMPEDAVKGPEIGISIPSGVTLEPGKLLEWWTFWYGILTPIAIWIFGKFWPSSTKRELLTKAISLALVILVVIISIKGLNFATLSQSFMALIMQVFMYDKIYKPMGLETSKFYVKKE